MRQLNLSLRRWLCFFIIYNTSVTGILAVATESFPSPKVVVIGVTGTGKSTLCNVLTGKNANGDDKDGFPVSAEPDACTYQTTMRAGQWLGSGPSFTIIDTPGLDDPTPGGDTANIAAMVEELKKIKFVNAFLIIFNGQHPRMDRSLKAMLEIFSGMFGPGYLNNTLIEFTRWGFDRKQKRTREKVGISEQTQSRDWNKKFRRELGCTKDLPVFFVDALYDELDEDEAKAFEEQTSRLWEVISKLPPYECKDFKKMMEERDRLAKEKKEADEKRAKEEQLRKRAEAEKKEEEERRIKAEAERNDEEARRKRAEDELGASKESDYSKYAWWGGVVVAAATLARVLVVGF